MNNIVQERLRTRIRKRAGGMLIRGALTGLSRTAQLHPRAKADRYGIRVTHDVPYLGTGLAAHTLDIYQPPGEGPHPVCLYIHGGGFRILSKDTHWWAGLLFAGRGKCTVFNINYRLSPAHRYPAAAEDCAAALTWILDNAARFGGDPSRLIIAGESAGANLTMVMALASCYQRSEPWCQDIWERNVVPKAVFPGCGIHHVSGCERFAELGFPTWITDRIDEVSEGYLPIGGTPEMSPLADPLLILERGEAPDRPLPPAFLTCGLRDPIRSDTERLERALADLGVPHEARYYPKGIHAFQAMMWRKDAQLHWDDTFTFLKNVW